jgi:putative membrane protein
VGEREPQAKQGPSKSDPDPAQLVDASRRTYLAGERTQLAWWRTGLTALAVALGVGRVVPELAGTAARWPYVIAGVGFALWGVMALAYGTSNRAAMERALREGRFHEGAPWALRTLTVTGIALGLLTALLILID